MTAPPFWNVLVPIDECGEYGGLIARDEVEARTMAAIYSLRCGHATITTERGLTATYINGRPADGYRPDRRP